MSKDATRATAAVPDVRRPVVALHCSGASGRQWQALHGRLAGRCEVIAPDFYGTQSRPHWAGARPFRLADEAAAVLDLIDAAGAPVHLVGHSYGGAVALRVALERPARIASLSLYEPSAFHVLRAMGPEGRTELRVLQDLATDIDRALVAGDRGQAAERFVDYWSGAGAWAAMSPERRAQIAGYMPKACLEFRALFNEPAPLQAYRRLRMPLLLMRGQHALPPSSAIVRKLAAVMQPADLVTVAGAGHMGPLTHAEAVAAAIAQHLATVAP